MMVATGSIVGQAAHAASRTRLRAGMDQKRAVCVYDLCESLGVDLRFQAVASLEGLYIAGQPPLVIVSALRPSGRQRLTCAHELGHHMFAHGTTLDEYGSTAFTSTHKRQEFLVNAFAEYLLVPKMAALTAVKHHGLDLSTAGPQELLALANYFGVGYQTLVHHLHRNLQLLPAGRADVLRRFSPKKIRQQFWPVLPREGELFVALKPWIGRAIDLHLGDTLLLPFDGIEEGGRISSLVELKEGRAFTAVRAGIGRVESQGDGWSAYVRVASRHPEGGFVGRSIYRFEVDDE